MTQWNLTSLPATTLSSSPSSQQEKRIQSHRSGTLKEIQRWPRTSTLSNHWQKWPSNGLLSEVLREVEPMNASSVQLAPSVQVTHIIAKHVPQEQCQTFTWTNAYHAYSTSIMIVSDQLARAAHPSLMSTRSRPSILMAKEPSAACLTTSSAWRKLVRSTRPAISLHATSAVMTNTCSFRTYALLKE